MVSDSKDTQQRLLRLFAKTLKVTNKSLFDPQKSHLSHFGGQQSFSEDRGCLEEGCLGLPGVLPDIS